MRGENKFCNVGAPEGLLNAKDVVHEYVRQNNLAIAFRFWGRNLFPPEQLL